MPVLWCVTGTGCLVVLTVVVGVLAVAFPWMALALALGTEPLDDRRYVWIGVGRALNHVGVVPAANSDSTWLTTAGELVRASARREDGRAVSRTESTEMLDNC